MAKAQISFTIAPTIDTTELIKQLETLIEKVKEVGVGTGTGTGTEKVQVDPELTAVDEVRKATHESINRLTRETGVYTDHHLKSARDLLVSADNQLRMYVLTKNKKTWE